MKNYKFGLFNLYHVPNLKINIPAAIVSSDMTKVWGDITFFNMLGADEINWQSSLSLVQFFCTGKMTSTRTSKIRIKVPIKEHTAPAFIILSMYLIIISDQKKDYSSFDSLWIYSYKIVWILIWNSLKSIIKILEWQQTIHVFVP